MNKISSGLLLLLGAGALGVFWANGYLADWIRDISARVGEPGEKTPIVLPSVGAFDRVHDASPRFTLAPVPPLPLFGGIA